jgi:hypothetical protein
MTKPRHNVELTATRSRVLAEVLVQTSTLGRRLEWCNDAQLRELGSRLKIAVDKVVLTLPERATERLRTSFSEFASTTDEIGRETVGHLLRVSDQTHGR